MKDIGLLAVAVVEHIMVVLLLAPLVELVEVLVDHMLVLDQAVLILIALELVL